MSNPNMSERCYEKRAATIRKEYADEIEAAMLKMSDRNQITTTTEGLLAAAVIALRADMTT